MKKQIISKTLLFIAIVLFVAGFESVFGKVNSLVGVAIVIGVLMYLDRDLTAHPWKNFLGLLGVNLLQGIFAYIAAINLWFAIPLNFIALFIVGFFFTNDLKNPLFTIFGLQYIFLLAAPVTSTDLPLRLLALATGAVIIILSQLLFNKNKLAKEGNKHISQMCQNLIGKLEKMTISEDSSENNQAINTSIKHLREVIYDKRIKGYYLSNEGRLRLKISVCLEKIFLLIEQLPEKSYKTELIPQIIKELQKLNDFAVKDDVQASDLSELSSLQKKYDSMLIYKLIKNFQLLYIILQELKTVSKEELNKIDSPVDIPLTYKTSYQLFTSIDRNSVRFTYAIRIGLLITLAAFIWDYFDLEYGRWLLFTVFSVTQPYAEMAKFRFTERLIGTLIGAVIFLILFGIVQDQSARLFLVAFLGYLQVYATSYRTKILTVTLCVLSTAALTGDPTIQTVERIIYVIIGIIIGMIANRLVLPHSLEKSQIKLVEMYKDTSKHMLNEVFNTKDTVLHSHSINNLFAASSLIEKRILMNNEILELNNADVFLDKQRKLNHRIYELYLYIQYDEMERKLFHKIVSSCHSLNHLTEQEYASAEKELNKLQQSTSSLDERILINIISKIVEECKGNFSMHLTVKNKKRLAN